MTARTSYAWQRSGAGNECAMKFLFSFAMRNINGISPGENFIGAEKHRRNNKTEFPGYDYAGNLK